MGIDVEYFNMEPPHYKSKDAQDLVQENASYCQKISTDVKL